MRRMSQCSLPAYRATALLIRYVLVATSLLLILANVGVNTALIAALGGGFSGDARLWPPRRLFELYQWPLVVDGRGRAVW